MTCRIVHLAIWAHDIEKIKDFYHTYFGMNCGEKYHNPTRQFTSYFLSCPNGGAKIELMHRPDVAAVIGKRGFNEGLAHVAISVGSQENVRQLTERLRADQFTIDSEPRMTGDGYFESVVLDPEGNLIEITE